MGMTVQCAAPNRLQVLVHPGVHSWRDAIMAAMRFRPDRILVGEVRDGSALELLKAWNTGHPGGVTGQQVFTRVPGCSGGRPGRAGK